MIALRVLLGVLIGIVLTYWGFWLFMTAGMAGHIELLGTLDGHFLPAYFASLYVPPVLIIGLSYLALRPLKVRR
ncbi:MAG: hypothetical protein ACTHOJ_10345 [Sphingomonas oligoaromativorans]